MYTVYGKEGRMVLKVRQTKKSAHDSDGLHQSDSLSCAAGSIHVPLSLFNGRGCLLMW